ncbi:MAG: hypothetical protein AAF467_26815 [Actinomycetota bacterium]
MWVEQVEIERNGFRLGWRSDDASQLDSFLDGLGVERLAPTLRWQPDLSIELGRSQRASRPMLALRHGERVVVRTRSMSRLSDAATLWIDGLTSRPSGPALEMHTLARTEQDGVASLTLLPRFVAADSGVVERLVPDATMWFDVPWVAITDGVASVPGGRAVGAIRRVVFDRGSDDLDLATSGRRALAAVTRLQLGTPAERLDSAVSLVASASQWTTVNTEDQMLASRIVADVVGSH